MSCEWPTSSWTFAVRASFRWRVGARRIHSRSGRTPISSELPCISMNLISFARYSSGIQSLVSTWPPAWTNSRKSCSRALIWPPNRTIVRVSIVLCPAAGRSSRVRPPGSSQRRATTAPRSATWRRPSASRRARSTLTWRRSRTSSTRPCATARPPSTRCSTGSPTGCLRPRRSGSRFAAISESSPSSSTSPPSSCASGATSKASGGTRSWPSGAGTRSASARSSKRGVSSASSAPISTSRLRRCSRSRPRTGRTRGSSRAGTQTSLRTASTRCSSTGCAGTRPPRPDAFTRVELAVVDSRGRSPERGRAGNLRFAWELTRLLAERRGRFDAALEIAGHGPAAFALVANTDPYTYAGLLPVHVAPAARFELGLDLVAPRAVRPLALPRYLGYVFLGRGQARASDIVYGHDLDRIEIRCHRPLPLQGDGEDLGDVEEAVFEAEREAALEDGFFDVAEVLAVALK